jgi:signal transduction histidine kinase
VEVRGFAAEQAALRRVATLVARAAPPEDVFAAVAAEIGRLLEVDFTWLSRYDRDDMVTMVGTWNNTGGAQAAAVGTRWSLGGRNVTTQVFETGRPARIDDYEDASGQGARVGREWGFRSAVGVPISVEGRRWGFLLAAYTHEEPLPADTEARLAGFAELVATAIANAEAQAALTASRARIVATADATRRRIEHNLHDGAQQLLVSLVLQLRTAQAAVPHGVGDLAEQLADVSEGLTGVLDELREIARGIHPAALADGGLPAALKILARRSAVPVHLDVRTETRFPEPIEIAAYYVASEALTNAAKHAAACAVDVEVTADDTALYVCVCDDGRGGADVAHGTGLVGLQDRVEALGGRLSLYSPPGAGTTVEVILPLTAPSSPAQRAGGISPPPGPGPALRPNPTRDEKN